MSAQLTHQGTQGKMTEPATSPAIGWRLRRAWYQIRLAVAEMNYASRRVAELQAPWTVDAQWYAK
jgi:hypothetical protein